MRSNKSKTTNGWRKYTSSKDNTFQVLPSKVKASQLGGSGGRSGGESGGGSGGGGLGQGPTPRQQDERQAALGLGPSGAAALNGLRSDDPFLVVDTTPRRNLSAWGSGTSLARPTPRDPHIKNLTLLTRNIYQNVQHAMMKLKTGHMH